METAPIVRRQGARRWLAGLLAALLLCGSALAQDRDAETRRLRSFADGVGKFLYFLAWPTATYDDVRFDGFRRQPGGVDLQLTLSGSSAFDDSLLWTQLVLEIRDGQVSDIRWGRHNAILVPPGVTMKNMLQALAELSREYARSNPGPVAGTPQARWTAGSAHPFLPHLVATTTEGIWVCEAGYKWYDPEDKRSLECVPSQMGYVGLRLQPVPGAAYPFIQGVLGNGPAAQAGIGEGTWLMSVDGVSMQNRSVDDAAAALRGLPGVRVTLGVAQPGATQRLYSVTRE